MSDPKAWYVRSLFSNIPLEYDALLGLLTFGQDRRWRAFVVERSEPELGVTVLDVATGTGLLAADLCRAIGDSGLVVGVDLTLSMLRTARARLHRRGLSSTTEWVLARAENLPFREDCFHSVSMSLALRNVSDTRTTLKEMARTTMPGGVVTLLDLTRPPNIVFRLLYYDYLLGLFPLIGRMVSKAWGRTLSYLGRSILRSRTGAEIADLMRSEGLPDARSVLLTAGIVCAVYGKKQ